MQDPGQCVIVSLITEHLTDGLSQKSKTDNVNQFHKLINKSN